MYFSIKLKLTRGQGAGRSIVARLVRYQTLRVSARSSASFSFCAREHPLLA